MEKKQPGGLFYVLFSRFVARTPSENEQRVRLGGKYFGTDSTVFCCV